MLNLDDLFYSRYNFYMKKINLLCCFLLLSPVLGLSFEDFQDRPLLIDESKVLKTNFQSLCGSRFFGAKDLDNLDLYLQCPLYSSTNQHVPFTYWKVETQTPNWEKLKHFNQSLSMAQWRSRLDLINPDTYLNNYFSYLSPPSRPGVLINQQIPLYFAPENQGLPLGPYLSRKAIISLSQQTPSDLPLRGIKIGVIPGHLGGKWSQFESRHILVPGRSDVVKEGDLTLRTSLYLEEMLLALGADVYLARRQPGPGIDHQPSDYYQDGISFLNRLKREVPYFRARLRGNSKYALTLRNQLLLAFIRKHFLSQTRKLRTQRMNQLQSDLIIHVHYNAGKGGRAGEQPIMFFIKGGFERHRITTPFFRFRAFLDLLQADLFDASQLAYSAAIAMSHHLELPLYEGPSWDSNFPFHHAIDSDIQNRSYHRGGKQMRGVYVWNLDVMKYTNPPTILTEGPFMDHKYERYRLLNDMQKPFGSAGTRMQQYAKALKEAVLIYANKAL